MEEMKPFSIFILGTTAVGKTKLSLQLCKYLNGQIVSCDSKQLYKHADLMTAKSTPEELNTYKHHMVDCLELQQNSYNRNKYYEQVKAHTQQIWKKGKTPIFIGGTNYYIQPILYNVGDLGRLSDEESPLIQVEETSEIIPNKEAIDFSWINKLTKQQKYEKLKQVDPLMAQKLHKNDENRVTSFLIRYYKLNQKPSQTYKPYTNELNNENTILFWVRNTDRFEHKAVVSSRIKQMLGKQGILQILSVYAYLDIHYFEKQSEEDAKLSEEKLLEFKEYLKKKLTASGIGQSIGYKQFFNFYFNFRTKLLNEQKQNQSLKNLASIYGDKKIDYQTIYDLLQKNYESVQKYLLNMKILEEGQDQLIRDTWAYCKRQITWIRNRIFLNDAILTKRFYVLDLAKKQRKYSQSDHEQEEQEAQKVFDKKDLMNRFQAKVSSRAINIIDQIMKNGFDQAYEKFQLHEDEFKPIKQELKQEDWKKFLCKECQVEISGRKDWEAHVSSKRHMKNVKYFEKKEQREKMIQFHRNRKEQEKINQQKMNIQNNQNE